MQNISASLSNPKSNPRKNGLNKLPSSSNSFKKLITSSFLILICISINCQDLIHSIKPGQIWPDNGGRHINAHGGAIIFYQDTYYWFGEYYAPRLEKNKSNYGVSCYSSKDLLNWKNEGLALKVINDSASLLNQGCIIERPKVIFNKKTGKFVMWFHHELKGQGYKAALTGVAVSDNITGPYKYIRSLRPNAGVWPVNFPEEFKKPIPEENNLKSGTEEWKLAVINGLLVRRDFAGGQMARDMTVFVDKDGKAYHVHSSEENMTLHFSELTDDYLDFTGRYFRVLPGESNEAPAIFFTRGSYFMFTSGTTGWKPNAARLATAKKISGEWKSLGNPCRGTEDENKITFNSQSTCILPVQGKKNEFIYMGDRWMPENLADSRHIWLPLEWENGSPVIRWYQNWNISKMK
jgi:beta-xylosidase